MGLFAVSLTYSIGRSIVAAILGFTAYRSSERSAIGTLAQAIADVISAVFVVGYVSAPVRERLGDWVLLMFVYLLSWEGAIILRNAISFARSWSGLANDDPAAEPPSASAGAIGWTIFGVLPALGAGFFLCLAAGAPGTWQFPDMAHVRP